MGHTPEQLYAVIADVDSYRSFLPFATSSHVLSAALRADPATPQPLPQQGWLKPPATPGETWDLEAELHVGAMGYSEGYVSRIELQKYSQVIVRLFSLCSAFPHRSYHSHDLLTDSPTHATGNRKGFNAIQASRHSVEIDPVTPFAHQRPPYPSGSLPRLRLRLAIPRRGRQYRLGESVGVDDRKV